MGEAHAAAAQIFETPRKSLFSDWPEGTRQVAAAAASPCHDWSQWPKRVKNEKKFTGSKIGAISCKIASRITTQNLKIGP